MRLALPADLDPTELWLTLGALALGLGLVIVMAVLERRPRQGIAPPLIPTTPVMFVGAVIAILALLHFLGFYGIQTGR